MKGALRTCMPSFDQNLPEEGAGGLQRHGCPCSQRGRDRSAFNAAQQIRGWLSMESVALTAPGGDLSIWALFWQAGWVVKLVMIGLLVASIWTWAIIV